MSKSVPPARRPSQAGTAPAAAGGDRRVIASLLSMNHALDALVAMSICLRGAVVVLRVRKRRFEKLLRRLEHEDGE